MARPKVYSDDQIIAALAKYKGLVYLAAKCLDCKPDTIRERGKVSPDVRDAIRVHRGRMVDVAEQKLMRAVERGEAWAISMVLKTLGKRRGYVERKEYTGARGGPIRQVREIVVRTREEASAVIAALPEADPVPR